MSSNRSFCLCARVLVCVCARVRVCFAVCALVARARASPGFPFFSPFLPVFIGTETVTFLLKLSRPWRTAPFGTSLESPAGTARSDSLWAGLVKV